MLAEELSLVVDEDPEVKRKEREVKLEAEMKAAAAAQAAAGGVAPPVDPSKPKSKAQRDRERAEARLASRARDEAAARAKKDAADAAAKAEADAIAASSKAAKDATDAQLKFESDLAREAISAKPLLLPHAMQQLVAKCESAEHACGGLLVLTQLHAAEALFPPLMSAIFAKPRLPSGATLPTTDGGSPDLLALVAGWAMPLGWLVCKCADLAGGQRALLAAFEPLCVEPTASVPPVIAPMLKALWEADAISDEAVLAWADGAADGAGGRRARKYAAPFADWLRTAQVVADDGTGDSAVDVA